MLFNSSEFQLFLVVTVFVFFVLAYMQRFYLALSALTLASLFFYGWWNPSYLLLIALSIGANFVFGIELEKKQSKALLAVAVAFNLGLIAYFKYFNFFTDNLSALFDLGWNFENIILPLAISFFTFQQIAYVVDCYNGQKAERDPVKYTLFVSFFPQLIAGPIVHYHQTVPQMTRETMLWNVPQNFSIGLTYFFIGLFKKLVIADGIAPYATPAFEAVENGYAVTFLEAWCAALAYTFQIYFDFSGYSDMAIGLARMFGIKLPINFNSPYKATSIIEFWRRWHMTLSLFLRDYLYAPLGGSRFGTFFQFRNIMIVMLLGGLWHGAGWTFIIWGGLHGIMICMNHASRIWWRSHSKVSAADEKGFAPVSLLVTFVCIVVTWVVFRADSMDDAVVILKGMAGLNGFVFPATYQGLLESLAVYLPGVSFRSLAYYGGREQIFWYVALLGIVWFLPNTHQFMNRFQPALNPPSVDVNSIWRLIDWRPAPQFAVYTAGLGLIAWYMIFVGRQDEFLYFQF